MRNSKILLRASVALLFMAFLPANVWGEESSAPKTCQGFRYIFVDSPPGTENSSIRFTACRKIMEPSSRPVNCEVVGEIDITRLKLAAYKAAENIWEYKKGLVVGASCVLVAETLSYTSQRANLGFRAYNSIGEKVAISRLQEEVRSGKRKIGELPLLESRVPGPAAAACSFLTQKSQKDSKGFASGAMLAIRTLMAAIHHARALKADAKLVWQTPIEQRQEKFEEYKRNVAKSERLQEEAIRSGFSVSKMVYDYLNSASMLDIPVGTTGDVAIVSPDTCIPDIDVEKLKASIVTFKDALQSGKITVGQNGISEAPSTEPEGVKSGDETPAEAPFNFPL